MEIEKIQENTYRIYLDKDLYSISTIYKCFYWYKNNLDIDISSKKAFYIIQVSDPDNKLNIDEILPKMRSDLIDFKTREIIYNETRTIRELLIAKAFAHGEEYDHLPPGNLNDPVGFRPEDF